MYYSYSDIIDSNSINRRISLLGGKKTDVSSFYVNTVQHKRK